MQILSGICENVQALTHQIFGVNRYELFSIAN